MSCIESLENISIFVYILKTFFISVFTYKIALKSINNKINKKLFCIY